MSRRCYTGRRWISSNRIKPSVLRYQTAKPSFPSIATDLILKLELPKQSKIMDLCAGTGQFTSILQTYFMYKVINKSMKIIAVESDDNNIQILNDKFQSNANIKIKKGSPSNLNEIQAAQSIDAIFCAQSFHHFATKQCIDNIHKILNMNGYLFLIWNRQTFDNNAFSQELKSEIIEKYDDEKVQKMRFEHHRSDILQLMQNKDNNEKFNVMNDGYISFPNSLKQRGEVDMIIDRVCNIASISMTDEKERYNVKALVHDLVNKHYGSIDKAQLTMHFDTDVLIVQTK